MSLADSLKSLNEFDVNDLDLNNAGIWPTPVKIIVAVIVFGLILGGGYWFSSRISTPSSSGCRKPSRNCARNTRKRPIR